MIRTRPLKRRWLFKFPMDKKIHLIAAMSDNRVIGKDNKLPWHFPCDLKKFKETTGGGTVIMGRKTFESIGKPLSNRENIVLSRAGFNAPAGVICCGSLKEAVEKAGRADIFIIGGESLYRQALAELPVSRIYLSKIYKSYEGDAHFPEVSGDFKPASVEVLQENDPKIEFVILSRK